MMLWGKTSFPSTQTIYQKGKLSLTQMAAAISVQTKANHQVVHIHYFAT